MTRSSNPAAMLVELEVPCNPIGDTVVELHLFRRMPDDHALPELLRTVDIEWFFDVPYK